MNNFETPVSKHPRTLYDVSTSQVFWRNFVAGVARSLGGILMYLLFFTVMSAIFTNLVLPKIQPFLDSYQSALKTLDTLNSQTAPQQRNANPEDPSQTGSESRTQQPPINLNDLLQDPAVQELIEKYQ